MIWTCRVVRRRVVDVDNGNFIDSRNDLCEVIHGHSL